MNDDDYHDSIMLIIRMHIRNYRRGSNKVNHIRGGAFIGKDSTKSNHFSVPKVDSTLQVTFFIRALRSQECATITEVIL